MGTSGTMGFIKNGIVKATYNHSDSVLYDLGEEIANFIRDTSVEEMNEIFDRIIMVTMNDTASQEQIEECLLIVKEHGDIYRSYREMIDSAPEEYKEVMKDMHDPFKVSTKQLNDWYVLLRPAQGGLNAWKHGLRYMLDDSKIGETSYSYIINLSTNELRIYEGKSIIAEIPFEMLKDKPLTEVVYEEEE